MASEMSLLDSLFDVYCDFTLSGGDGFVDVLANVFLIGGCILPTVGLYFPVVWLPVTLLAKLTFSLLENSIHSLHEYYLDVQVALTHVKSTGGLDAMSISTLLPLLMTVLLLSVIPYPFLASLCLLIFWAIRIFSSMVGKVAVYIFRIVDFTTRFAGGNIRSVFQRHAELYVKRDKGMVFLGLLLDQLEKSRQQQQQQSQSPNESPTRSRRHGNRQGSRR